MSVDLAAKLWSSSSLHNHKFVVITLAMHFKKTPSSILLLSRLHVLVCTMPGSECPREHRWQAITTELGRTQLSSTMLLYLCDEKFSISPYVFKPWYVSAILYIWSAKRTLQLVPDTRWTTVYQSMRAEPWVYLFTHSVNILYLFNGNVHSSHYRVEQYDD